MLELAAGNPLALLELPATLAVGEVDGAVTAPERIRRTFAARLDLLPDETRRALVLAAAEPDTRAVRVAVELLGLGSGALAPAEAAGLMRLELGGIVFRHPLVRSLAYSSVDPIGRREAHAALAEALPDPGDRDRRAWHLAAAATEPDEGLAIMLEQTADRAEARGGHAAAARAVERAARLSRDGDAIARRLTRAARLAFWAGEGDRGVELATEAAASTFDPSLRAEAVLERQSIRAAQRTGWDRVTLEAITHIEQLDPDIATRLLFEPRERARRRVRRGRRPRAGAATRRGRAAGGAVVVSARSAGRRDRLPRRRRARAFDRLLGETEYEAGPIANVALDLIWAERYELVRSALGASLVDGRRAGNRIRIIWNQACFAHLELRLGRLREAQASAAEAITLADTHGIHNFAGIARAALAGVHAWRGDAEACRGAAAESLAAAIETRSVSDQLFARGVLGQLALGLGKHQEAVDALLPAERTWIASTHVEPSGVPFMPDLVEAHVYLGNREAARASLERFRDAAERANRQWALAAAARCEGLLADVFVEPFEQSLALLESSSLALERARTHLAFGERLRRAGQRREARVHLRHAHEAFSAVDAAPWVERAASELRATGETVGPRTPDRRSQLSPQEFQIAQLVGEGKTNKEIAAQLYLSPKTIEYHLANAYRKLDIHSRAELTRVILEH